MRSSILANTIKEPVSIMRKQSTSRSRETAIRYIGSGFMGVWFNFIPAALRKCQSDHDGCEGRNGSGTGRVFSCEAIFKSGVMCQDACTSIERRQYARTHKMATENATGSSWPTLETRRAREAFDTPSVWSECYSGGFTDLFFVPWKHPISKIKEILKLLAP